MARTRLAAALLVPPPLATEVDGVRRALGDRRRRRIAPHITLVPPVNIPVDRVPDAAAVVQDAARVLARRGPLHLQLGPVATFGADTGILYLAVGGDPGSVEALHDLQEALRADPLAREERHGFVPHVTVADRLRPAAVVEATALLAGFRSGVTIDRVHLLEHRHEGEGTRWEPIVDARFADPVVVGRGGFELELRTSSLLDPGACALIDAVRGAETDDRPPGDEGGPVGAPAIPDRAGRFRAEVPRGAEPVVVDARRGRQRVGVSWGWAHPTLAGEVLGVAVAPEARHQGVGGQLRRRLEALLAAYGESPGHPDP